jgi:hypothetical protein
MFIYTFQDVAGLGLLVMGVVLYGLVFLFKIIGDVIKRKRGKCERN